MGHKEVEQYTSTITRLDALEARADKHGQRLVRHAARLDAVDAILGGDGSDEDCGLVENVTGMALALDDFSTRTETLLASVTALEGKLNALGHRASVEGYATKEYVDEACRRLSGALQERLSRVELSASEEGVTKDYLEEAVRGLVAPFEQRMRDMSELVGALQDVLAERMQEFEDRLDHPRLQRAIRWAMKYKAEYQATKNRPTRLSAIVYAVTGREEHLRRGPRGN